MPSSSETLAVVMPVYNEEEAIADVIRLWDACLSRLKIAYTIHLYNDGSQDNSLEVCRRETQGLHHVEVHDHPNRGHGPTILKGYRDQAQADWVFQVDSDNEISPDAFASLWADREQYDLLIGQRTHDDRPFARTIITGMSSLIVRFYFGKGVHDVNCPYRMMRTSAFQTAFHSIPEDAFAPNVILSGVAAKQKLRIKTFPIQSIARQTGTVSIKRWRLLKAAVKSFNQTIAFASKYPL